MPKPYHQHEFETPRLYGLSDGVFAIVLTLLVLELKVPATLAAAELFPQLGQLSASLTSYAVTFAATALIWMSHNRFFSSVLRLERGLQYRNLLFLFFVTLLPFSIALLGRYPLTTAAQLPYGLNMVATGAGLWWMWRYAAQKELLRPKVTPPPFSGI